MALHDNAAHYAKIKAPDDLIIVYNMHSLSLLLCSKVMESFRIASAKATLRWWGYFSLRFLVPTQKHVLLTLVTIIPFED